MEGIYGGNREKRGNERRASAAVYIGRGSRVVGTSLLPLINVPLHGWSARADLNTDDAARAHTKLAAWHRPSFRVSFARACRPLFERTLANFTFSRLLARVPRAAAYYSRALTKLPPARTTAFYCLVYPGPSCTTERDSTFRSSFCFFLSFLCALV